jgi:hypothetical protein
MELLTLHARNVESNKNEGDHGLPSDFFVNASVGLYVHLALLMTVAPSLGRTPIQLTTSTVIPVPKGDNADKRLSCNYGAISLISPVGKIIYLIILNRILGYTYYIR